LILKPFNPNIISTFSVNIIIAEADLIKYIIGDSKIVKIGNMVEEIIRIDYYRYLFSFIISYEVRAVAYCFYNIKILTKYINLGTITTVDEEPYNLTAIDVYIIINLDIKAR
jgi:hypothetical protein